MQEIGKARSARALPRDVVQPSDRPSESGYFRRAPLSSRKEAISIASSSFAGNAKSGVRSHSVTDGDEAGIGRKQFGQSSLETEVGQVVQSAQGARKVAISR